MRSAPGVSGFGESRDLGSTEVGLESPFVVSTMSGDVAAVVGVVVTDAAAAGGGDFLGATSRSERAGCASFASFPAPAPIFVFSGMHYFIIEKKGSAIRVHLAEKIQSHHIPHLIVFLFDDIVVFFACLHCGALFALRGLLHLRSCFFFSRLE